MQQIDVLRTLGVALVRVARHHSQNQLPCTIDGLLPWQLFRGFEHRKQTFLAKCDKSSAGEIDEKAREICAEINARPAFFYYILLCW